MRIEAAQRRIQAFERKFGQPHLFLAAHAALPLALTPDLLYRIWANFQRDLEGKSCKIPWISVSDLLLSSLCDEVGYELYEMEDTIRHELLQKLSQNQRQQVAEFLLQYVRKDLESRDSYYREFAQSQSWTAHAYRNPEEAIKLLADAINTAYRENPDDLMRLTTLTELFAQDVPELEKLVIYARAIGHAARNRFQEAKAEMLKLKIKNGSIYLTNNIKISIPSSLLPYNLVGQEGNTKIYSVCTNQPWNLPFDALVIPSGFSIGFGGLLARSFRDFLGEVSSNLIVRAINATVQNLKIYNITPESPLLVSLPSALQPHFPQINFSQDRAFMILASVENLNPTVYSAFKATQAIINQMKSRGLKRLVIPLLGAGRNKLPVNPVSIAILSAISYSLRQSSDHSIEKIFLVDIDENSIQIINQVANTIFSTQEDNDQLLSESGVDYTHLRYLLVNGEWKAADEVTAYVMLQACGQQERGWLDFEDMVAIPDIDLQTIDDLWFKYSRQKFGFSVQKQIWLSVGGQPWSNNDEVYKTFG